MANNKLNNLVRLTERIKKNNAIGIIYNVPKLSEVTILASKLLEEEKHIVYRGTDVATNAMLKYRLGYFFKVKHFDFSMLPTLLDGKMVTVYEADFVKDSFARAMEELYQLKIPLLLIFTSDAKLTELRNYGAYNRVMTIEYDYASL